MVPARRPGPARPSSADWDRHKALIEHHYLIRDESARQVADLINNLRLFSQDVSLRQVKLQAGRWNWEKKRVKEHYHAMDVISQHYPNTDLCFWTPSHAGHHWCKKEQKDLKKEMKRKAHRRGRPNESSPTRPASFDEAMEVLVKAGVHGSWPSLDGEQHRPLQLLLGLSPRPSWTGINPSSGAPVAGRQGDEEDDFDDSSSEASDDTVESMEEVEMDTRELMDMNFPSSSPRYRLSPTSRGRDPAPRQNDRVPNLNAFAVNVATSVLPESANTHMIQGGAYVAALDASPTFTQLRMNPEEELDLADLFCEMTLSYSPHVSRKRWLEKNIGSYLAKVWPQFDTDHSKRLIVEFSAYYLLQCLAGYDTLDERDDSDRSEARDKLAVLLKRNNPHNLSTIYWISTILASHGKRILVMGFYLDCWECAEACESEAGYVVRPIMRFIILQYTNSDNSAMLRGMLRASEERCLDSLQAHFDAKTEFENSMSYLIQQGQRNSPAFLIIQMYRAWYLQDNHDSAGCIDLLCSHMSAIEKVMGKKHLVTIGCYSLLSKGYENERHPFLHVSYVEEILLALQDCARPLQPLKDRAMERMAGFEIAQGNLDSASIRLESVFRSRLVTTGVRSGDTWSVARTWWNVLRMQGQHQRAQDEEAQLLERFNSASRS